ncbi:MAG: monovalent cation/H+ antiporter subunit D [Hyphomonadaceae bacterium]|nr:monovalent cation/H+ antiporter subunit D [Hyphomonadaceae bacterium]GIK50050.1 MAG: monovalent cation/H+ antiporter subunit D [Alphaproteobacteria bacterium]
MNGLLTHLIVAPIVLPLGAAALVMMIEERPLRIAVSFATVTALLLVSATLLLSVAAPDASAAAVYRIGDWPAPFGIVLVLDRLSAMMVALASTLGLATLVFSLARWDRAGPRFHALFLLLLAGLNGAFLTGDLFNLFVFFEVLLAASYGLVLHGSGAARVKAGLHYIAVNLGASSLFLLGVSAIYGVAGTLNMADLAGRLPELSGAQRTLFEIGCAVLGVAFLIKAGIWPLGFWLPPTYSASSAPAAAMFAIMTKVGVYAVLRVTFLFFGPETGDAAGFASPLLLFGGALTIAMSAAGMLAARTFSRIAGFSILISSGAVLAVVGAGGGRALSGALYYMISSTFAVAAFFLLVELLNRARGTTAPASPPPVFEDEYRDPYEDGSPSDEVGVVIPAAIALISGGFILCALLLAGLPPLSGFVGKFAMMAGLSEQATAADWVLIALLTLSSFTAVVALLRIGIESIWASKESVTPRVRGVEFVAIAGLLAACVIMTVNGAAVFRFTDDTVAWLSRPQDYIGAVLGGDVPPAPANETSR